MLNAASQLALQSGDARGPGIIHLVCVLAEERRSMAGRLLLEHGLAQVRLVQAIAEGQVSEAQAQQALLEDVIDRAANRADQLGTHYTGTEHMLLALAQHSVGAQLLHDYGVDGKTLIEAVYRQLLSR